MRGHHQLFTSLSPISGNRNGECRRWWKMRGHPQLYTPPPTIFGNRSVKCRMHEHPQLYPLPIFGNRNGECRVREHPQLYSLPIFGNRNGECRVRGHPQLYAPSPIFEIEVGTVGGGGECVGTLRFMPHHAWKQE